MTTAPYTDTPTTSLHQSMTFAVTPYTGNANHHLGLHPDYLKSPSVYIRNEISKAINLGANSILLHRLSGRDPKRVDWPAKHSMDPFSEMSAWFASDVMGTIEGWSKSVRIGVGLMWLVDERPFNFGKDYCRFCGLIERLSRIGVSFVTHDTAGSDASGLSEYELRSLSDACAGYDITYIVEGRSKESERSGVPTLRIPKAASDHLPHRQGLPFDPNAPFILGVGPGVTEEEAVGAARLNHPVWAWGSADEYRRIALAARMASPAPRLLSMPSEIQPAPAAKGGE